MEVTYTIQMVAKISGVGVHTIRAWEKRYKAIVPKRDTTGHRVYSREDAEKLILLSELCLLGYSISKIANQSSEELKVHLKKLGKTEGNIKGLDFNLVEASDREEIDVSQSVSIMLFALKAYKLDIVIKELSKLTHTLNLKDYAFKILSPFIQAFRRAKEKNELNPNQEQTLNSILKSIIQRKLYYKIHDKLEREYFTVLICTIDQDNDEVEALTTALIAQNYQFKVIYLGRGISPESLGDSINFLEAKLVILHSATLTGLEGRNYLATYINKLSLRVSESAEVCVHTEHNIIDENNFKLKLKQTRNLEELDKYLATKV